MATKWRVIGLLCLPRVSAGFSVVISRMKAADTGSLLTHFICLVLSLSSMKQMERNCIISHVERLLTGYLLNMQFVKFLAPPCCVRSIVSGRRGLHDA